MFYSFRWLSDKFCCPIDHLQGSFVAEHGGQHLATVESPAVWPSPCGPRRAGSEKWRSSTRIFTIVGRGHPFHGHDHQLVSMGSIDTNGVASVARLPDEVMFSIVKTSAKTTGPRLGRLQIPGRRTLETPTFLALTSRGVVPHISQDTFATSTSIEGVYIPLEDCTCKVASHA